MTRFWRATLTRVSFGALLLAATAPSWRLLLPAAPSTEEQLLESFCGASQRSSPHRRATDPALASPRRETSADRP